MTEENANANQGTGNEGNNNGGDAPAWTAQLPADLKAHEAFTSFPTIGELGKAYLDTTGKVKEYEGKVASMIPRLGDNPTEAEILDYRTKLGIPETTDGYKIERPELPEGLPYDEALEKDFITFAHQNNITPNVANAIAKFYNERGIAMYKKSEEVMKKMDDDNLATIKKTWGEKFEVNAELAHRTFMKAVERLPKERQEAFKTWTDVLKNGNDPQLTEVMYSLYELLGGDKFIGGSSSGSPGGGVQILPGGMPNLYPNMK